MDNVQYETEDQSEVSREQSEFVDEAAFEVKPEYSGYINENVDATINSNDREEYYQPPEYRPQVPYDETAYAGNMHITQQGYQQPQELALPQHSRHPSTDAEAPYPLANNFHVNFPPPRPVVTPTLQPRRQFPPSSSFYNREDTLVSEQRYNIPGIQDSRQYPIYRQNTPVRRPFARQRL